MPPSGSARPTGRSPTTSAPTCSTARPSCRSAGTRASPACRIWSAPGRPSSCAGRASSTPPPGRPTSVARRWRRSGFRSTARSAPGSTPRTWSIAPTSGWAASSATTSGSRSGSASRTEGGKTEGRKDGRGTGGPSGPPVSFPPDPRPLTPGPWPLAHIRGRGIYIGQAWPGGGAGGAIASDPRRGPRGGPGDPPDSFRGGARRPAPFEPGRLRPAPRLDRGDLPGRLAREGGAPVAGRRVGGLARRPGVRMARALGEPEMAGRRVRAPRALGRGAPSPAGEDAGGPAVPTPLRGVRRGGGGLDSLEPLIPMHGSDWLVLLGGIAAISWVNWYFFFAGRRSAAASAGPGGMQEVAVVGQ